MASHLLLGCAARWAAGQGGGACPACWAPLASRHSPSLTPSPPAPASFHLSGPVGPGRGGLLPAVRRPPWGGERPRAAGGTDRRAAGALRCAALRVRWGESGRMRMGDSTPDPSPSRSCHMADSPPPTPPPRAPCAPCPSFHLRRFRCAWCTWTGLVRATAPSTRPPAVTPMTLTLRAAAPRRHACTCCTAQGTTTCSTQHRAAEGGGTAVPGAAARRRWVRRRGRAVAVLWPPAAPSVDPGRRQPGPAVGGRGRAAL
jgi:hypothetical protein